MSNKLRFTIITIFNYLQRKYTFVKIFTLSLSNFFSLFIQK